MPYINHPSDFYWDMGFPLLGAVACESHWIGTTQLHLQGCQPPSMCQACATPLKSTRTYFRVQLHFFQLIGKLLSRASHQWDSYFFQATIQASKLNQLQLFCINPSVPHLPTLSKSFSPLPPHGFFAFPILKPQTDFTSLTTASWIISLFLFPVDTSVFSDCISL